MTKLMGVVSWFIGALAIGEDFFDKASTADTTYCLVVACWLGITTLLIKIHEERE